MSISPSIAIPQSPDRLIAMQENRPEKDRPKKPERSAPEKVKQVLELINSLDTTPRVRKVVHSV